jgi:hypothetical protein
MPEIFEKIIKDVFAGAVVINDVRRGRAVKRIRDEIIFKGWTASPHAPADDDPPDVAEAKAALHGVFIDATGILVDALTPLIDASAQKHLPKIERPKRFSKVTKGEWKMLNTPYKIKGVIKKLAYFTSDEAHQYPQVANIKMSRNSAGKVDDFASLLAKCPHGNVVIGKQLGLPGFDLPLLDDGWGGQEPEPVA